MMKTQLQNVGAGDPPLTILIDSQVGTSKTPDTLDLFPSSVREPKIEGLYMCPVRAEIFNRTSRPKTGQSGSIPDTWQPYS